MPPASASLGAHWYSETEAVERGFWGGSLSPPGAAGGAFQYSAAGLCCLLLYSLLLMWLAWRSCSCLPQVFFFFWLQGNCPPSVK